MIIMAMIIMAMIMLDGDALRPAVSMRVALTAAALSGSPPHPRRRNCRWLVGSEGRQEEFHPTMHSVPGTQSEAAGRRAGGFKAALICQTILRGTATAAIRRLGDDRSEGRAGLRAEGTGGADEGDGNKGRDQAILNGGRTGLVPDETSNEVLHDHSPTHSQRVLARLRSRPWATPRG